MSPTMSQQPPRVARPSELEALRKKLGSSFTQMAELISNIRKPLPDQTGDGTDLDEKTQWHLLKTVEDGLADLTHLGITDIKSLLEMQHKVATGQMIDDKSYLMEGLIKAVSGLPQGSQNGLDITNSFITQLWNDLQHPPLSYLGAEFSYRSADGSNNSLVHPKLGAANTPYARTVKPQTMQPGALPDPGVIFDSIMSRKVHEPHPNRISSVLFYLASIIIHDIFRTDHNDYSNSQTSSYLDLAPLYGSNQEEQDEMRLHVDGKIKPDCFSEKRLLAFPPGVGVLLIMFNRFHNYVVEQLALINEGGRFTKPTNGVEAKIANYDEDLFQTGRLVTCGLYVNIILIDYVRTILNLNRTDSKWQLNPRNEIRNGPAMGCGNQVSAEFNLVYRWHSTVSDRDEEWTKMSWNVLFPNRDPKSVSRYEFLAKLKELDGTISKDPTQRPFAGLKRDDEGRYSDDSLVKILTESIEDCANSFGAQRVPAVMRAIECLGIEQARAWNLATLNEFRKHFALEPHRTFESINPDKHVADQLKHLYDHPDLVELYPGLVAEEAKKPMVPGAGLTPSFTVSRAVLSDAVGLVRGDRFYTIDYHPKKLTNWGYSAVDFDLDINNGCVFYKLFMRAFPDHFEPNSVYAHFPMTIPSAMKVALGDLDKVHLYDFSKPKKTAEPTMVLSYPAVDRILGDKDTFKVTWGKAMEYLMGKPAKSFMLAGDGYENAASRKMMRDALYIPQWMEEVKIYYEKITIDLIKQKSYTLGDLNQVDIVRDVGNLAHVHFCADLFMLPLKTADHPGVFSEHELYLALTAVFTAIFFDLDPGSSFALRQKASEAVKVLGQLVQANVEEIQRGGFLSALMQFVRPQETKLQHYGKHLIQRLLASEMDVKELVWSQILGTAGGMVPNQGQLFAQTLEYFLTEGRAHLPEINRLAKLDNDPKAFDTLMHYFLEGSRLNGETAVFRSVFRDVEVKDGDRLLKLKQGDKVMVNLRAASRDPAIFADPDNVVLTRPIDSYIHLGAGPHQCLGLPMTRVALTTMLKVVGRLDNLRPAKGPQGRVAKVVKPFSKNDGIPENWHYHAYLTENHDIFFPFPCALKVNWDGAIE